MDFAAILALATVILKALAPLAQLVADAIGSGRDVTEALAAENVGDILPGQGHLDAAVSFAHANRAAEQLRIAHAAGETAGMTPAQLAYVEHALATHALVVLA